jgi:phosphoribosyl 1,2-cyclic phosphodiesterase
VRARVWGCRGSLASPGPETVSYGGNTSCLSLELEDDTPVCLDSGTGIRAFGLELVKEFPRPIHLLLTHLHLDHVEGLGFFAPLWLKETVLHIWGPPSPLASLEERITRYFSPPLFPIQLSDVPAELHFHDVPDGEFKLGSASVWAQPVTHRGPTVGYRIEENGHSLAYIPDHEPYIGCAPGEVDPEWLSGFALAEQVGTLVHDGQYSEGEYETRRGFGHSSVEHAVSFAHATDADRLVLFHHDPLHTDADLEVLVARARELWGNEEREPELAREGTELAVPVRHATWAETA